MPNTRRRAAPVILGVLAALGVLALAGAGSAQNPLRPSKTPLASAPIPANPAAKPRDDAASAALPQLRVGALLPLTGPSVWYAEEMRHGLELAIADLNPAPRRPPATASAAASPGSGGTGTTTGGAAGETPDAAPTPALQVVLDVRDVHALDVRDAAADFARLAAAGASVVLTASPTPTLAIYPLAASRDILVVHQGWPSDRFPSTSRTLLHARPGVASRVEALAAGAWDAGIRRLALLSAGDEFGKAVRAALSPRWRDRGAPLVHEESFPLETPDLPARLRHLVRLAPEAVCLAFRGADLGNLARALRDAGYTGLLAALDDDPAALLAAGPTLSNTVFLVERFVPEPDSRGERFARTYQAKFGRAPSHFAANAYDTVSIIAEATRLALEEGRGLPGGARLREAVLARRTFPSVYGGQVVIRDDGTFDHALALFRVDAGQPTFVRYVSPWTSR